MDGANQSITQSAVTSLITSGLAPYVPKSYVDTRDALNATQAYVDAGDATRLHLAQINTPNGVAGLDPTGRIAIGRLNVASTQRFPSPFLSPSAYNTTTVSATAPAEVSLYGPITVADPGYTYRLFITGHVVTTTSADGVIPVVRVRAGSTTGPILAASNGLGELYYPQTLTSYTTAGSYTYSIPGSMTNFDVIALGGGGSGQLGNGGAAGVFAVGALAYGTSLPLTTTTLAVTVGSGGVYGPHAGAASTVGGAGIGTLSAAGGNYGQISGGTGRGPGSIVVNGNTYTGGADQTLLGNNGNPSGGGGAGRISSGSNPGNGADGAVWILAYNVNAPAQGGCAVLPTPLIPSGVLTGSATLYVTLACKDPTVAGTVSALNTRPALYIVPIPA